MSQIFVALWNQILVTKLDQIKDVNKYQKLLYRIPDLEIMKLPKAHYCKTKINQLNLVLNAKLFLVLILKPLALANIIVKKVIMMHLKLFSLNLHLERLIDLNLQLICKSLAVKFINKIANTYGSASMFDDAVKKNKGYKMG